MDKFNNELIKRILSGGDDSAFSELIKIYLKPVYNFLYHFTRDLEITNDLTQETFIKSWRNLKKFDQNKNFKTWLFTIARNTAYDYLKKKKTIPFSDFINEEGYNKLENISDETILPDELLTHSDAAQILEKKLLELPEHYQIILTMHYIEDFSLQEISDILKIPYNTVKSQHQRGLKALKEAFVKKR